MKIIRFLSDDQRVLYGKYDEDQPDCARIIDGDIFQDFHVTPERAKIKHFLPPVQPSNILALGLNYRRHAEETEMDIPEYPILFMKATGSAIGHREPIVARGRSWKGGLRSGTGRCDRQKREKPESVGSHGLCPGVYLRQ